MADPDFTLANYIVDTTKTNSQVTGTYATFVDLGVEYIYRALLIYSSLDTEVTMKFTNSAGDKEMVVPPGWSIDLDAFRHDDVIEIKHNGSAPTEGYIKMLNWRAE
jgi:hypothetical protein